MSTKPGKQIMKQALFKSKGYKLFNHYKEETEKDYNYRDFQHLQFNIILLGAVVKLNSAGSML